MSARIPHATIVNLLALTLGDERARALWTEAVRGLSIPLDDSYTRDQALLVLRALSTAPGTSGLAARIARTRVEGDVPPAAAAEHWLASTPPVGVRALRVGDPGGFGDPGVPPPRVSERADPRPVAPEPLPSFVVQTLPSTTTIAADVLALLTPSLGDEKARDAVDQYAKALKLSPHAFSADDAVVLLDAMSGATGLLGVVARFAKVRFRMRYPDRAG
jgi:hypothetical protein